MISFVAGRTPITSLHWIRSYLQHKYPTKGSLWQENGRGFTYQLRFFIIYFDELSDQVIEHRWLDMCAKGFYRYSWRVVSGRQEQTLGRVESLESKGSSLGCFSTQRVM